MTAPTIDLANLTPEPIGVPDHTASGGAPVTGNSGQGGEPGKARPGIFDRKNARGALPRAPKPKRDAPPKLSAGMRQQLADLYCGIGAMIKPFDELTGQTIIEQSDKCAKSVYDLAQTNDSVRRFVIGLTTTSVAGAVFFAHLPILLVLARHSSNERIKMGAGVAYMGLKMSDDEEMAKMFAPKTEPEETPGA